MVTTAQKHTVFYLGHGTDR